MKNKKRIVIIAMILVGAFAIYWFVWRKKAQGNQGGPLADPGKVPAPSGSPQANGNSGINPPAVSDNSFPMGTGSKGSYVKALQQLLKDKYKIALTVDGIFGPKTKAALTRAFKMYSIPDLATFNSLFTK